MKSQIIKAENDNTAIKANNSIVVAREAPNERNSDLSQVVGSVLNTAQLSIMQNKTPEWAIKTRVGGGGKQYTYVPHGYVTDTLNKAFGWDWDLILDPMFDGRMYAMEIEEVMNAQGKVTKTVRHVAVCGHIVVRIHNPNNVSEITATITKSGFGSQLWLPTMELGDALKAARSDLLKTCAFQLGIALDLYWNERAEVSEFESEQASRDAKKAQEAQALEWAKQGLPTNFASLLSESLTKFQFDGNKVAEILQVEIDALFEYNAQQIVEAWEKLSLFNAKK